MKFRSEMCESKALNRALRTAMQIKSSYLMAITHDPEMKARFPQAVDVVKTAEGSKVIYS